jgi:hypothetical protein
MMANLHFMENMVKARLKDFHNEAAEHRLAKQVQSKQAKPVKEFLNNLRSFAKTLHSQKVEATQTSELPQIKLSNEQAG